MSRSYKHSPVCTYGGKSTGTRKYWKRKANRMVRRTKELGMKSKSYKRYMSHGTYVITGFMLRKSIL